MSVISGAKRLAGCRLWQFFYLASRLGWQYFPLRRCCCKVCLHGDIKAASSWADYLLSMWADCIWLRWDTAEWLVCKESMHGIVGTFSSLQKTTGCCNNYCTVLRTVRWVISWPFLLISWFPLLVVVQVQQGLAQSARAQVNPPAWVLDTPEIHDK